MLKKIARAMIGSKAVSNILIVPFLRLHNLLYRLSTVAAIGLNNGVHPKHHIVRYKEWFLRNISDNDVVLDVGCNTGMMANLMSKKASFVYAVDIAKQYNADSIHPGFGFLSERADFAQAVIDSGLVWIGPSPDAIKNMGDKMTARISMRNADVPVIPGEEVDGGLEEVLLAAGRVGYPLLLKATAGGGGGGA